MAVSATRPLAPGQELMLSYGERSNDDFFIHYGVCMVVCWEGGSGSMRTKAKMWIGGDDGGSPVPDKLIPGSQPIGSEERGWGASVGGIRGQD